MKKKGAEAVNIKAAIFDMDGTLVDSIGLWDVHWKVLGDTFLNGEKFVPAPDVEKAIRTMALREAAELLHRACKIGESGDAVYQVANETFRNFYANSVTLKAGMQTYLQYCKEKGIRAVIASATAPELIEIALEHCGVRHYFEEIFSCSVVGKGKEAPDIFLHTQAWLGTETAETWVFEDSFVALETAQRIGMPTVGIYDRYNPWQDAVEKASTIYIGPGENVTKLMK